MVTLTNNSKAVRKNVGTDKGHLLDILSSLGLLSKDQMTIVQQHQKITGQDASSALLCLGFVSEETLDHVLNESRGLSSVDLENATLDVSLIGKIPKDVAQSCQMLPLSLEQDTLTLAMTDPFDIRSLDKAQKYFPDVTFKTVSVTASALHNVLDRYYGYTLSIEGLLKELESAPLDSSEQNDWTSPVVRLVEALIMHGIKTNSSDIHFEPDEHFVKVRYRIDGILRQYCVFHKSYWPAVCVRLKVLTSMNIANSRQPQNGRATLNLGLRPVDFRASSHPTVNGECIVLRILDKRNSLRTLEDLGFASDQVDVLKKVTASPQGLFVITGPTGSGKTTTLYSLLHYLNSIEKNIVTLEQPVEYKLQGIRQSDISQDSDFSFADGVRSLLRQDPDIIFIGEIRDEDTAQMAVRAAMTGHLVFTTLHTNDVFSTVSRLRDLGISQQILSETLLAVMSQRLLRKICVSCKEAGCPTCHHTGYASRVAVGEVLLFDSPTRSALGKGRDWENHVRRNGFQSMRKRAQTLVKQGLTSQAEVFSHLGGASE